MNSTRFHIICITILWIGVHALLLQHYGIRTFVDSAIYIDSADYIIKHWMLEDLRYIFYIIPITLISICRFIYPDQVIPFIILQCIVSYGAVLVLYYTAKIIFNNALAGLSSAVIFLLWIDNLHWNITVMTESLMCSFICVLLYQIVRYSGKTPDLIVLIGLALLSILIRPTGVVIVISIIVFLLNYHWETLCKKTVLKYSVFSCLLIIAVAGAYFMFDLWDFTDQYHKGNIITFADILKEDNKLNSASLRLDVSDVDFAKQDERPLFKIAYFISHNPLHLLKSACIKIWYLLSGTRPYYSMTHNVFTFLWNTIIYVFFYLGLRKSELKSLKIFSLTVIVVNCALIGMATVDWDNRFYIPMEPGIVVFAGGGVSLMIQQVLSKKKKIKSV
ncbi:MAG TPA: glycosyltransferase family 39 protein [Cyclobacteriaceae bacterium]|nr:glycosyltransferase family 39 protein [Cyclobacteriaceae bacterium]